MGKNVEIYFLTRFMPTELNINNNKSLFNYSYLSSSFFPCAVEISFFSQKGVVETGNASFISAGILHLFFLIIIYDDLYIDFRFSGRGNIISSHKRMWKFPKYISKEWY